MAGRDLTAQLLSTNQHQWLYNGVDAQMDIPKGQLFQETRDHAELRFMQTDRTKRDYLGGTSFEAVSKAYTADVGVNAQYCSIFSASVKTEFERSGASTRSTAMCKEKWYFELGRFTLIDRQLTESANQALNVNTSSGWEDAVVRDYGVLCVEGLFTGAETAIYQSTTSYHATDHMKMCVSAHASVNYAGFSADASITVSTRRDSELKGDSVTLVQTSLGGDATKWDWSKGWSENPMVAQKAWLDSAKANPHVVSMKVAPIWDLIDDPGRRNKLKNHVLGVVTHIKDKDEVYIKSSLGHYIANSVHGKGYAYISKTQGDKAKFRVEYGEIECSGSYAKRGIRLKHKGEKFDYSKDYRYMYASTSGWRYVCFDQHRSNTKQLWRTESAEDGTVLGNGTLEYDTPVVIRDCFVLSVLCECGCKKNDDFDYLCSQYENAESYFDKDNEGHTMTWTFERANQ